MRQGRLNKKYPSLLSSIPRSHLNISHYRVKVRVWVWVWVRIRVRVKVKVRVRVRV
jgi:hypothetical protein